MGESEKAGTPDGTTLTMTSGCGGMVGTSYEQTYKFCIHCGNWYLNTGVHFCFGMTGQDHHTWPLTGVYPVQAQPDPIPILRENLRQALSVIAEMEWSAGRDKNKCPWCRNDQPKGHVPGCRLEKLLREGETK